MLTDKVYEDLVGANATGDERFRMNAYLLGGLTEHWRAHREYAGVLHFVYLMSSYPGVYTSDHFRDVEKLELDPYFSDYVGEAFKPLGVYIRFWQPELAAGAEREFAVMMVNDYPRKMEGNLALTITAPAAAARRTGRWCRRRNGLSWDRADSPDTTTRARAMRSTGPPRNTWLATSGTMTQYRVRRQRS